MHGNHDDHHIEIIFIYETIPLVDCSSRALTAVRVDAVRSMQDREKMAESRKTNEKV